MLLHLFCEIAPNVIGSWQIISQAYIWRDRVSDPLKAPLGAVPRAITIKRKQWKKEKGKRNPFRKRKRKRKRRKIPQRGWKFICFSGFKKPIFTSRYDCYITTLFFPQCNPTRYEKCSTTFYNIPHLPPAHVEQKSCGLLKSPPEFITRLIRIIF